MTALADHASHPTGRRSRPRRAAIIAAFAWLVLAQTLLVVHSFTHNAEHHVACALCVAADHASGPIQEPIHAIATPLPASVAQTVRESASVPFIPSYYSRGPPQHLES